MINSTIIIIQFGTKLKLTLISRMINLTARVLTVIISIENVQMIRSTIDLSDTNLSMQNYAKN